MRMAMRVVLPAPLGPSRPWISPSRMARLTSLSAVTGRRPPKVLLTLLATTEFMLYLCA